MQLPAILIIVPVLFSCGFNYNDVSNQEPAIVDCPRDIVQKAYQFALQYDEIQTEYEWGGQDPLRVARLDCSGLVIRCYGYALEDTGYSLILPDMSSSYIYEHAATLIPLSQLQPGDLVFMGEAGSPLISHIAIYDSTQGDEIFFIDSTQKDANGTAPAVNGVSKRSYPVTDQRFKAGGIMKVVK